MLPNTKEALKEAEIERTTQYPMWTYYNAKFYPFNPELSASVINIRDIIHALAHLCRFGGHCEIPYTVGMHSILIYELGIIQGLNKNQLRYVLLHDASEAYLIDLPTPIKRMVPDYESIEQRWHNVILDHFDVIRDDMSTGLMNMLDKECCLFEASKLQPASDWWKVGPIDYGHKERFEDLWDWLSTLTPEQVRDEFITRYYSTLEYL